jgi:hypothetical protein
MQIGDCFYDKNLNVILKIVSKDQYTIKIQTISYFNQTVRLEDGSSIQSESIAFRSISEFILVYNWKTYYEGSLVKIDSSIVFKLAKLMNVNFLACSALINKFNKIPEGANCFLNCNRIDLDFAKEAISITNDYIGYIKNPRFLPIPNYHISIEDYSKVKTNIDNVYNQIKEIWKTVSNIS